MGQDVELNEFPDIIIPRYLPESLQAKLIELKTEIEYAKANPYFSYKLRNHTSPSIKKMGEKKMDESRWNGYKHRLNKELNSLCLIYDERMKTVWSKFEKIKKGISLQLFYILNNKYDIPTIKDTFNPYLDMKEFEDRMLEYHRLKKNPSEIISHLSYTKSMLEKYNILIAPDGSDCFNNMNKDDPDNKVYLDEDGDVPLTKNMDFYITDDEYDDFMYLLDKIILKLTNRLNDCEKERKELNDFLMNPTSRKINLKNIEHITFARSVYLVFLRLLGKPCYSAIVTILDVLFDTLYSADDIKKWTKTTKDKYDKLKKIVEKDGYSLDGDCSVEKMFFKK